MKFSKNIKSLVAVAALATANGCNYDSLNQDPTRIPETTSPALKLVLPAAQAIGTYNTGDNSRFVSLIMQQFDGTVAQQAGFTQYQINESDIDGVWQPFYSQHMKTLDIIIRRGSETNSPYYRGIAKILMANSLGTLTSFFGDIPYSDAFKAAFTDKPTVIRPKYDTQQAIYVSIQRLLDEGIADLGQSTSVFVPAGDDLMFGGSRPKWVAAARSLKARYFLHLSKREPTAFTNALAALNAGSITSNDNDLGFQFDASQTNAAPLYQFQRDRSGTIEVGSYFIQELTKRNDPRQTYHFSYVDSASAAGGSFLTGFGSGTGGSETHYGTINAQVPLMTYSEGQFIRAECLLRTGGSDADVQTALSEGIRSNMAKVSSDPRTGWPAGSSRPTVGASITNAQATAYIVANATLAGLTPTQKLAIVMYEKYVALYTQSEVWVDWRRTGFPTLTPVTGGDNGINPGGGIPRRFTYPISERLYNVDNIPTKVPSLQVPRLYLDN